MKKEILASIYLLILSVSAIISAVDYWETNIIMSIVGFSFAVILLLGILGYFINNKFLLRLNAGFMIAYSVYFLVGMSIAVLHDFSLLMFGFGALVIFMTLNISVIYFTINKVRWGDLY